MSSAILYLAIVAIWACVLIPRWLRRDSARGGSAPVTAEPTVPDEPEAGFADETQADADDAEPAEEAPRRVSAFRRPAEPLSAEESRRRMLAARRRLLLMLIGLEAAAIALAVVRLAAVWVVVPPTIMLAGYLLLLREAAQADAERAQYEAEAVTRALERDRARDAQARRDTPAAGTSDPGHPRRGGGPCREVRRRARSRRLRGLRPRPGLRAGPGGQVHALVRGHLRRRRLLRRSLRDAPAARRRRLAGAARRPCRWREQAAKFATLGRVPRGYSAVR